MPHERSASTPPAVSAIHDSSTSPAHNRSETLQRSINESVNALRTSFGASSRFPKSVEDPRPHSYRAFTPLLQSAQGRFVSPHGTFSSGERSTLVGTSNAPVSFYDYSSTLAVKKHSRGVKRSARRFVNEMEEASPGPIYRPFEGAEVSRSTTFPKGARFPVALPEQPHPSQLHHRMSSVVAQAVGASAASMLLSDSAKKKRAEPACTFGVRHSHLDAKPSVVPMIPTLAPASMLDDQPPYRGHFSKSERPNAFGPSRDVMPGPGQFLKVEYTTTAPSWGFGRRHRVSTPSTPGPGAYRIEKAFVNSKGPKFSKSLRDAVACAAGTDSPGPALYSRVQ